VSKIVCVDNHVLIWGIEQKARSNQQEMISRTKRFIDSLSKDDIKAIVPAVVLSEFLMPIPPKEVGQYLNIINQYLMVVPYDAVAAMEFARIWQSKTEQKVIEKLRNEEGIGKNHLKIDSMIVATAVTRKATCIYSHDGGLKKFAEDYIEVKEIPDLPSQQSLLI
jgi:predicted nucleic acid-binding protein